MNRSFGQAARTILSAIWLGSVLVAFGLAALYLLPEGSFWIKIAEAMVVAGIVELVFQTVGFRRILTETTAELVKDALELRDGVMKRLSDDEVKSIRRRCTERLVAGQIDPKESFFDLLTDEIDAMLKKPFALNTEVSRHNEAYRLGDEVVWRAVHSTSFSWCNQLNETIVHQARVGVTLKTLDPEVEPLQEIEWFVNGKKRRAKKMVSDDGSEVTYYWRGKVKIKPGKQLKVSTRDVRILPLSDKYMYTPSTPHKGMHLVFGFDREVFPEIMYLGWGSASDGTITPAPQQSVLAANGWHLPEHAAVVSWKTPVFTEEERLALPSLVTTA